MAGKAGDPASKNLVGKRWSVNYDAGYYKRNGDHGAVTYEDAKELNKTDPSGNHKGTRRGKSFWGIEAEIGRLTDNADGGRLFPLLTVGLSFHIPGATTGEGHRIVESLHDRGHKINLVITDRAYSNGVWDEYAVPIRKLGGKLVFDYKVDQLGNQTFDPRGFVQVGGSWFLNSLPQVLVDADAVYLKLENKHKAAKSLTAEDKADFQHATNLYRTQVKRREKFRLKPKGRMDADLTRRYLIPTDAPRYAAWKAKAGSHQGVTVMMKAPEGKQRSESNPGGLKHEQYFHYKSDEWRAAYGMRNGVESTNRNLKRTQFENIADPDARAVRGNTFTYIVIALAAVVENLRQIVSFYKEQLALTKVTPKNKNRPSTFWQHNDENAPSQDTIQPPD
jgi:hypothetical protein